MNAPIKRSDALDAYADMLVTYSGRRVRLATTLAVCAVLGVCVAVLTLASYWTLDQHTKTANSVVALRYAPVDTEPHSSVQQTAARAQRAPAEPLYE
jgi:hypothetical protein